MNHLRLHTSFEKNNISWAEFVLSEFIFPNIFFFSKSSFSVSVSLSSVSKKYKNENENEKTFLTLLVSYSNFIVLSLIKSFFVHVWREICYFIFCCRFHFSSSQTWPKIKAFEIKSIGWIFPKFAWNSKNRQVCGFKGISIFRYF